MGGGLPAGVSARGRRARAADREDEARSQDCRAVLGRRRRARAAGAVQAIRPGDRRLDRLPAFCARPGRTRSSSLLAPARAARARLVRVLQRRRGGTVPGRSLDRLRPDAGRSGLGGRSDPAAATACERRTGTRPRCCFHGRGRAAPRGRRPDAGGRPDRTPPVGRGRQPVPGAGRRRPRRHPPGRAPALVPPDAGASSPRHSPASTLAECRHSRQPRRDRAALVGRHCVPAGLDDHDAGRGEARRRLRTEARAPGRPDRLPRRVGAVRAQPEHARADRVPGGAGAGRRRTVGQRAGGDRRRRLSAGARTLLRADWRRLRRIDGGRPAGRRAARRPSLVALDLLCQPADRDRRVRRPPGGSARPLPDDSPRHRLRWAMALLAGGLTRSSVHEPRRHDLSVVVGPDGDRCSHSRGALGRVRRRRAVRARAARPTPAVPQPRIRGRQRRRVHRRDGLVRLGDLPAALPAGGEGLRGRPSPACRCCR